MKLIGKAPRGALFILLALALGCVIAACGSASSSSSTTSSSASSGSSGTTTTTAATGSARRTALAACLKQHGVTLPSRPAGAPPGGASGGAPGSGTGTGTGTTGTGTTPRRGFFGGGGGFANNPKLQAAFKACGANFGFRRGNFAGRLSHTAVTKYVTCVRQHGYNLPNPNFSGKGPIFPANIRTNQKFIAASKPCQSLLIPPRPSGSGGTSTTSGA
ncbi:MAG TPA: hypothetical protein VIH85_02370 [Solirubrobacteraceae bacterium]